WAGKVHFSRRLSAMACFCIARAGLDIRAMSGLPAMRPVALQATDAVSFPSRLLVQWNDWIGRFPILIKIMSTHLPALDRFIMVAQVGNFSRAAELLHISQPALTKSIQILEERLGEDVFVRESRGVSLTTYGKAL